MSVAIAPAPADRLRAGGAAGHSSQAAMPYSCQACARRKVKCDKTTPTCSSCRKGRLECVYQAPAPRARKRKPGEADGEEDVHEKLARYEHILRQNGLLEAAGVAPSKAKDEETLEDPIFPLWNLPSGKLVVGQGKSRYVNSHLWRNLGDDEMERLADENGDENAEEEDDAEDAEDQTVGGIASLPGSDPLTVAFMGASHQNLIQYHPSHTKAMSLWATYVENVEPIIKVLHIPSTLRMVESTSQQPALVSKADECLLFAIYHFAVMSMTDQECLDKMGAPRATLTERYHLATRQALVNASFLSTTAMTVLQALVMYLVACQHSYDPHTYWILTGVAARISQRVGLHRDGEALGLPPFDVEMRRRLFYRVLPLDGAASRMAGTAVSMPDSWDTRLPLNIDDDQIWPGMTEMPVAREGATEMIFCLSRSSIGMSFAKTGKGAGATGGMSQAQDAQGSERAIREAEKEAEERYIRYCDIVNPLHMLTISSVRAGITAMRLRVRLHKVRDQTATTAERRELFWMAQKILDTDAAARAHAGLDRYRWHTRWFFLWGTWDSLVYILTTLWRRSDLLSSDERDVAWNRLEEVCRNHEEFLKPERALYVAFGRLMLKAWEASHSHRGESKPEPDFITTLRCRRKARFPRQVKRQESSSASQDTSPGEALSPSTWLTTISGDEMMGDLPSDACFDAVNDFRLDAADWMLWDQLIQDHQAQEGS
ncbi:hypothetical protein ACHAQA_007450 [Verticillium albo-atrum]